MTNRRSFLAGILVAAAAPVFIKAEVLMKPAPIWVPPVPAEGGLMLPTELADQLVTVGDWQSLDYGRLHRRSVRATINGHLFRAGVLVQTPAGRLDAGHELQFQRCVANFCRDLDEPVLAAYTGCAMIPHD